MKNMLFVLYIFSGLASYSQVTQPRTSSSNISNPTVICNVGTGFPALESDPALRIMAKKQWIWTRCI